MKNIFKKIAVVALAVLMCVSMMAPAASAAEKKCPGEGKTHTAVNCTYTVLSQTEASCEAAGFVTGKCTVCREVFAASSVAALGHDWDYAAATCTAAATRTCKVCNKVEITEETTGHTWGEWNVTGGVCKVGEKRIRTCAICGLTDSETMKEAHSWVVVSYEASNNCTVPGKAEYECENAGCTAAKTAELWLDVADRAHGNFIDWNKNTADPAYVAPTCSSAGQKTVMCDCEGCDYTKVVAIPMLTHKISDLRFVDQVFETKGCNGTGTNAYWQCFECGARYKAVYTVLTPVYADYGTTSPTYSTGGEGRYVVYWDYSYDMTKYGALVTKDSELTRNDVVHEDGDNTTLQDYVSLKYATCTEDGYQTRNCILCGFKESKVLKATGHTYYGDVASSSRTTVLSNLGMSTSTSWADCINPAKTTGMNKFWKNKFGPTCTDNTSVEWCCLNVDKNNGNAQCSEVQVGYLNTAADKALGHKMEDKAQAEAKPAATCISSGVLIYECERKFANPKYVENGTEPQYIDCDYTKVENVEPLGHKWDKVASIPNPAYEDGGNELASITTYAATCQTDGLQCYDCARCTETKTEVVAAGEKYHVWSYVPETYVAPTCETDGEGYRWCTVPGCTLTDPTYVVLAALGHDYHKLTDQEIKNMVKNGEGDVLTNSSGTTIAKYVTAGDCTQNAVYQLYCQRSGCNMFTAYEISEGFNSGAHEIRLLQWKYNGSDDNGAYSVNTPGHGTAGTKYNAYKWYCNVKTCPYYGPDNAQLFYNYGLHYNPETGAVITYKDVPDERISGAASLDEARKVKAPVDENGNITAYAVEIPGTSLVWRYVAEVSCDNDGIEKGGLWCVSCNYACNESAGQAKAMVSAYRADYHAEIGDANVVVKTVQATCKNYGYTEYSCPHCDYIVQIAYEPIKKAHETVVISRKDESCEVAGSIISKCSVCDQIITEIIPATGHHNISGIELTTSCLDINANIENRRCDACKQIIVSAHSYVDGKCKYCGIAN